MEEEIVRMYTEDLMGSVKISKIFNISKQKVLKILERNGIERRKDQGLNLSIDKMVELYDSGMNTWEVAEAMGTSQTTIRRKFKKIGKVLESSAELSSKRVREKNPRWTGHNGICGSLWRSLLQHSKSRGIKLEITKEDLWSKWQSQNGKCAISGVDLSLPNSYIEYSTGKTNASVDRIDSSKSYHLSNIQWVSKDVNLSKWHMVEEDFIKRCMEVSSYARR